MVPSVPRMGGAAGRVEITLQRREENLQVCVCRSSVCIVGPCEQYKYVAFKKCCLCLTLL